MVRSVLFALAVSAALASPATAADAAAPKVLRYAFPTAESGFDPAQVTDLYSNVVLAHIFEAPLEYEYLAQPVRVRTNTAAAQPEISADFRRFVFQIKPGIYFADDPAFKGQRRELTAQDYVYTIKRHYDPRWKSGKLYQFESERIVGLSELRRETIEQKKPFDYDREVDGLRALDRYRFEARLALPSPRFHQLFTDPAVTGAVAREVVEFYGDRISEHPVGTGPFRLTEWRRSSRMVLERNPAYREVLYDEHASAGDTRRSAIAAKLKGRRMPMVDRVEVSVIEEPQPRWLSFLGDEQDVVERIPDHFCQQAVPNGQLAPHLVKRGIQLVRYQRNDVSVSYFAMEHPVVGGYAPEKVALRRAISLAVDVEREIRLARYGQAIPAQSHVAPQVWGYDPAFKSEMSEFDRAKARALLDLYGYVDRDGDGFRERPDGSPLTLEYGTQPDRTYRDLYEQWDINMKAIGVRMVPLIGQWSEHLKASRAGKLMMWGVAWSGGPDGETFLNLGYGPNKGQANHARFDLPAYNALFERQRVLPDGPERAALLEEAKRLMVAYMPYKVHVHRIWTDLSQPWVTGYHRNVFVREFWKYVDVDMNERA
ncbi:MAG TPA: ABC transporter substrate-binding protein, partial [Burkholderiaceae bacterium]|nr:ABC transporter substrate-binding protein [Burkholderiaceae bacterium]